MEKFKFKIAEREAAGWSMGHGKPLIFLHGWGGCKESWELLMTRLGVLGLTEKHCLIALDLPGFGESEEPSVAWGVGNYVVWFEEVLDYLNGKYGANFSDGYDLVVHSFGGRMLFKMLGQQETKKYHLDRLVIIAAAGIKHQKSLKIRIAGTLAKTGKKVLTVGPLKWVAPLAQKGLYKVLKSHDYEKTSGVMRETFLKVIDEDLRDNVVQGARNPALIFWGKKDTYVPVSDARLIHLKIPGSKLIIFPDGKHGIHRTKAEEIADLVSEFIK